MSEQDKKRAEEAWSAAWIAAHDKRHSVLFPKRRARSIAIIAAAPAQARREGEESMRAYCDKLQADRAECHREGAEAMRDDYMADFPASPSMRAYLFNKAVRLLAKEKSRA